MQTLVNLNLTVRCIIAASVSLGDVQGPPLLFPTLSSLCHLLCEIERRVFSVTLLISGNVKVVRREALGKASERVCRGWMPCVCGLSRAKSDCFSLQLEEILWVQRCDRVFSVEEASWHVRVCLCGEQANKLTSDARKLVIYLAWWVQNDNIDLHECENASLWIILIIDCQVSFAFRCVSTTERWRLWLHK